LLSPRTVVLISFHRSFAFVEFAKPEHAALAVAKLNGYALDKNHKFVVNKFADLEALDKVPETYKEPDVPAEPKNMVRLAFDPLFTIL
jgi:RNA recognition motif-containing protein